MHVKQPVMQVNTMYNLKCTEEKYFQENSTRDIIKLYDWITLEFKLQSSGTMTGGVELSYLNKYILCFLNAQHRRVGSVKGSLLSLAFAAAEGIFLTFLLLRSPWYKAILKNLSLFSTFPSIRATLLVCKLTIYDHAEDVNTLGNKVSSSSRIALASNEEKLNYKKKM